MNAHIKIGLAMLVGFGLGAIAAHRLEAQPRPPAYVISEIDVTNPDAYTKEYVPLARECYAPCMMSAARLSMRQTKAMT